MDDANGWAAAIELVLRHEGGFVNDPVDPGGATNFGISLRFLKAEIGDDAALLALYDADGDGDLDAGDMAALDRIEAIEIYRRAFWYRYDCGDFPALVGVKFFDLCVNAGSRQATLILQRAVSACGVRLVDDGALGPLTRNGVRAVCESYGALPLKFAMRAEAAAFYRALIAAKPAFEKYRKGWLRRAYS